MCIGDALISHIIKPDMVSSYLESNGWIKTVLKFTDTHVFVKNSEWIIVPLDSPTAKYKYSLHLAIRKIAEIDRVEVNNLIKNLSLIQLVK